MEHRIEPIHLGNLPIILISLPLHCMFPMAVGTAWSLWSPNPGNKKPGGAHGCRRPLWVPWFSGDCSWKIPESPWEGASHLVHGSESGRTAQSVGSLIDPSGACGKEWQVRFSQSGRGVQGNDAVESWSLWGSTVWMELRTLTISLNLGSLSEWI